jgi:hypothetical protein
VDGKPWPVQSATALRLPRGSHVIEPAAKRDGLALIDLNAQLQSASAEGRRITFEYSSDSRAIARFDRKPAHIELDGFAIGATEVLLLPRGVHRVTAN